MITKCQISRPKRLAIAACLLGALSSPAICADAPAATTPSAVAAPAVAAPPAASTAATTPNFPSSGATYGRTDAVIPLIFMPEFTTVSAADKATYKYNGKLWLALSLGIGLTN